LEKMRDHAGRPGKKRRAPPPEALKYFDCDLRGRPEKKKELKAAPP
jgi:hypothetical protein